MEKFQGYVLYFEEPLNRLWLFGVESRVPVDYDFTVSPAFDLSLIGVETLAQLEAGTRVSVDAVQDGARGGWKAHAIHVLNAAPQVNSSHS